MVLEQMHVDQVMWMLCDKERLKTGKKIVRGSPRKLEAMGLIGPLPEMSYVERLRRGA